jgi:tetratricopeptide (TPR) repeat protein
MGNPPAAAERFDRARHIARGLVDTNPVSDEAQEDLVEAYRGLGVATGRRGDMRPCHAFLLEGVKTAEHWAAVCDNHRAQESILHLYNELGDVNRVLGNRQAARDYLLKAIAVGERLAADAARVPARRELAYAHEVLGEVLEEQGEIAAARKQLETALRLQRSLVRQTASTWSRTDLGWTCHQLGTCLLRLGENELARKYLVEALALLEAEARANPGHARVQRFLGQAYFCHAQASLEWGERAEARRDLEKYRGLSQRTSAAHPGDVVIQGQLADCYRASGWYARATLQPSEAIVWYTRALEVLDSLHEKGQLTNQSKQRQLNDLRQARADCQAILEELKELETPIGPPAEVPKPGVNRAVALACRGRHAEAAAIATQLRNGAPNNAQSLYDAARCYALSCTAVALERPPGQLSQDEAAARSRYAERAVEALIRARDCGYTDVARLKADPDLVSIRQQRGYRELVERLTKRR